MGYEGPKRVGVAQGRGPLFYINKPHDYHATAVIVCMLS